MAQKTKENSKGEQGKVLESQDAPVTPQVPVGEAKAKAKKNMAIAVKYLNKDGNEAKEPGEIVKLVFTTKSGDDVVDLTTLPPAMLRAAAAFGLNTTVRNAHNSTEHSGGDGVKAMKARIATIVAGEWRGSSDGEDMSIPLVIEAMIRAKKDKGQYVDGMEDVWLKEYRGLDKAGKAEWTKRYSEKKPIMVAMLTIKAERAAAKAAKAAGGDAAAEGDDF